MRVNKITWDKIGHVTEPGRHMYTFGFCTVTEADIEVWRRFPHASFALIVQAPNEMSVGEEYKLGAFDISRSEA